MACVLFSNSAGNVHFSQTYRNTEMVRERITFTFDPRDMLLSIQIGFSFVKAAVACAVLESISAIESSPEAIASRHLKLVTVFQLLSFHLNLSLWMP